MAMTDTKLLIPQGNDDDLYIARNHAANEDLLVIVLYMYADHIFYLVTSGKGSGRVHPVYLPFTEEGYKFCFHAAVEAIASVDPSMAEMLFPYLQKKCKEAKTETTTYEH